MGEWPVNLSYLTPAPSLKSLSPFLVKFMAPTNFPKRESHAPWISLNLLFLGGEGR